MRRLLIIAVAAAALVFTGCGKGLGGEPSPIPTACPSEEPALDNRDGETVFREATLYFVSDEGFIVPVTKLIPREEGIARACLSYMASSPVNDLAAREMGLKPPIPEGARLDIRIADGSALVDIGGLAPLESAEAELGMVQAIVNTLTGFPTVDNVTITRDGGGGFLENGTALPVRQEEYPLNPEESDIETSAGGVRATLYFPNTSGALTVPVTRSLSGGDICSLVSALIAGTEKEGLMSCFPENTLLLGAAIENGRAVVDLSEDFGSAAQTEGMFTLAYRTLYLTLSERFPIEGLVIRVNGVPFEPERVTPPSCVNGD